MSDKYAVPNKLPAKQVSILAHRKRRILNDKSISNQKRLVRIRRFAKKKRTFTRAESFVMNYIKAERTKKRTQQLFVRRNILKGEDASDQLLLVMRHAGKAIADSTVNNIFSALRLGAIHRVVFLRNSKENQVLLKVVEPYVAYGYPTNATVRDLVFKKGFAIINGKRTLISSNTIIEEQLGEHGIICLEDIIHEIFTLGPKFDVVTQFLCPFLLKNPRDGWKKKISKSYSKGGEYGNRKKAINSLITRCI